MSLCSVPVLISTGGVVLKPQRWSRQRYRQRYGCFDSMERLSEITLLVDPSAMEKVLL